MGGEGRWGVLGCETRKRAGWERDSSPSNARVSADYLINFEIDCVSMAERTRANARDMEIDVKVAFAIWMG